MRTSPAKNQTSNHQTHNVMGQTYSVRLKVSFKDERGAVKALQAKIARGSEERVSYSLDHYRELGVGTETIGDLLRIFFGGWQGRLDQSPYGGLVSDFDACYGWEGVMMDAFDILAPYLEDGSSVKIWPDSGVDEAVVTGGEATWKC